jgi:3-dehydroquinate synthase
MNTLHVGLPERAYDIQIGMDLLKQSGTLLRNIYGGTRIAVVSDTTVWNLYGDILTDALRAENFDTHYLLFSPGEQTKDFDNLKKLYAFFADCGLTRTDSVIAFGGGVSNDGEFLLSPIREYAKKYAFFKNHAKIVTAEMRNDAGIVGAAMLYLQR